MQILGLLGMYFDDGRKVEVEKYLLFFRLALTILCGDPRTNKQYTDKFL